MLELLSPAGSAESLRAAVRNGADAVYLGGGDFNARRNAKNFTEDELVSAIGYCHEHGVKLNLTLNTLLTDREIERAAEFAAKMSRAGVDAFIVQDLGVAAMLKNVCPDVPRHASTQTTIHDTDGARAMESLGFTRVILARELSREQIAAICGGTRLETEVFAHGALCMCYSGQCYMSALIGRRSGNRGMCAQPCRMKYAFGGSAREPQEYALSLKDLCLADDLRELESVGVTCVKIEGRMRSPAYVAAVTGIYARLIDERRGPDAEELRTLRDAFSRGGFTDGYYEGKIGRDMFGVRGEPAQIAEKVWYNRDGKRKPYTADMYFAAKAGRPLMLAAECAGARAAVTGPVPDRAETRQATADDMRAQLRKTGGTPFSCGDVNVIVDDGLLIPLAAVNALRRECLAELQKELESRASALGARPVSKRRHFALEPVEKAAASDARGKIPAVAMSFLKTSQVSPELLALRPARVILPAAALASDPGIIERVRSAGPELSAALPRIIRDDEVTATEKLLKKLASLGVGSFYAGNIGHIELLNRLELRARGDFGLNICNSRAMREYADMGLASAVLSFELTLAQARDIEKYTGAELIAYGRLPLMITENCPVKNHMKVCGHCDTARREIIDRTNESFPIIADRSLTRCRPVIYNAHKLYLADKLSDLARVGLESIRLDFTTENPVECTEVARQYLKLDACAPPPGATRGLYYRGVY